MEIYHGGYTEIREPVIIKGRFTKDFGEGFYSHDYDIAIGAMANDQIYNYVADFINGVLTREQFWVLARFMKSEIYGYDGQRR